MKYFKLIQRLHALKYSVDRKDHHPEANVLSHSLQAYTIAKKEGANKELWVAAAFHDIGKGIETLGHDKLGVDILKSFGYNNSKVLWLIENHIRIINFMDGSMKRLGKVKEMIHHPNFIDLVHLRRIDYSARNSNINIDFSTKLKVEINNLLGETNE